MTDGVTVEVRRSGRRFEAEAVLDLATDLKTAWDTITDYDALPRFMPGIRACRVVERQAGAGGSERLRVEQRGEFRFLLFAQAMTVHLDVEHQPQRLAVAKATRFDLGWLSRGAIEVFEGRYDLTPKSGKRAPARVQVRYQALIGLRLPPPPPVGSLAVRQNLAAQLNALAQEISRRSQPTA
jgi:hypothetical protein